MSGDRPTGASPHAGRIFISYRRKDSGYVAQAIRDRLVREFGPDAVFMDIDDIPLGVDFREHVANALARCRIVLAVIGDLWAGAGDGTRRIDDPEDLVRVELEIALRLAIPVIPVLVGHAVMPAAAAVPGSLRQIVYRNAAEVRSGKPLGRNLDDLARGIAPYMAPPPTAPTGPGAGAASATAAPLTQDDDIEAAAGKDRLPGEPAPLPPKPYRRWVIVLLAAGMLGAAGYLGITRLKNTDTPPNPSPAASETAEPASSGGRLVEGSGSIQLAEFEQRRTAARAMLLPMLKQLGDEGLNAGGVFDSSKRWLQGTVVKVCFLDGGLVERRRVARVASEWTLYANIGLDFGDWNDPRRCAKGRDPAAQVRVTFSTSGNWAFVGRDALSAGQDGDATLGLESAGERQCRADAKFCEQAILHEFGHVLGFDHGWTSPQGNCQQEMNWDFIYRDAKTRLSWTKETVDQNLRPRPSSERMSGDFDRRSVMNYELPAEWFKKGKENRCFLSPLGELSLRDKLAAMKFIP